MANGKSDLKRKWLGCALILCGLFVNGCGKEQDAEGVIDSADIPASEVEIQAAGKSARKTAQNNRNLAQADEAVATGKYNKAARQLLQMKMSGKIRTADESWRYNQIMTDLQSRLADAAADGDAESQKTMDMLRAASSVR